MSGGYTYVNGCISNKHQIVSVGEVEEIEANCREHEHEWRDSGVTNGDDEQVRVDRPSVRCEVSTRQKPRGDNMLT